MFYSRKPNRNWFLLTTAMVGGFALGMSYKKYGSHLHRHIRTLTNKDMDYEDYMNSHEPDA